MHDLPAQTLLQQLHARPISGEELEVMGKKAASRYLCGECRTLSDAVVETVKQAGLSPEQVKRVIEFTNTSAYIEQFNKLGSDHKYVEFHGGPADPSVILKDLNDGGGGTVFDRGMADYSRLPMEKSSSDLLAQNRARLGLEKVAVGWIHPILGAAAGAGKGAQEDRAGEGAVRGMVGAALGGAVGELGGEGVGYGLQSLGLRGARALTVPVGSILGGVGGYRLLTKGMKKPKEKKASVDFNPAETAFEQMFQVQDAPLPYAEPFQDIIEMREKLADSKAQLTSELNSLEVDYIDVSDRLYGLVKQAALEETPLGHVVQAWAEVVPGPDFVKVAFGIIGPRLVEENVLDYNELGSSMSKTASSTSVVDTDHPLVETFAHFCDTLLKLAAMRDVLAEVADAHEKADYFLRNGLTKVAGATGHVEDTVGLIPKAWRGAKGLSAKAADPASRAMRFGVGKLFGSGAGETAAGLTHAAVRNIPEIAAVGGALEVRDRMRYSPAYQAAKNAILSRVPYTQPYMIRQYDLQSQGMM